MKTAVVLLLMLVSSSMGGIGKPTITPLYIGAVEHQPQQRVGIDLCLACVEFAGQALNELLNIILNAGVIGGCADLCSLLDEKVHSKLIETVCNLVCDYVGVKTFIDLIEKADLDPIYYCELLKICPVKDDGDAHILSFVVKPHDVVYGTRFHIEMLFQTTKGTGTGEIDLEIDTQDGVPVVDDEFEEPLGPGAYNVTWPIDARPNPNCDPMQEECENWLPGNYTAHVAICNGECGSSHPHSQIYDTAKTTFNVVKN
jgi:hypothetical protein